MVHAAVSWFARDDADAGKVVVVSATILSVPAGGGGLLLKEFPRKRYGVLPLSVFLLSWGMSHNASVVLCVGFAVSLSTCVGCSRRDDQSMVRFVVV